MTFYWWSHWFWITVMMGNLCFFPLLVVVHTYPSQESSQEFNRHQTENTKKLVTKLYQTSTTWVTEASIVARTTTAEKTILQSVTLSEVSIGITPSTPTPPPSPSPTPSASATPSPPATLPILTEKHILHNDGFEEYYYDQEDETQTQPIDLQELEEENERKHKQQPDFMPDEKENDIKRSAEHFSKSSESESKIMELNPKELSLTSSPSSSDQEEKNNYTNYTSKLVTSTNLTSSNASPSAYNVTATHVSDSSSDFSAAASSAPSDVLLSTLTTTTNSNVTVSSHAPPATPKIVKNSHGSLDWLNSMADAAVSPPTARVTTDTNEERFPFTLENVHKSEDLRREESEPRTRKSKGLSAEYKHGYASINYSSETKNLLTRSASTTVNEYESEESNISSEALSVQRAYFMDVGAISAICFTVFGICCTVGTIGIVLYRRRFLNKPQALSEPDSSVYIDDSTMRDNSDEMYSLDNDSFLNSLEAMTIQNYWTDTVKHTKL